MHLYPNSMICSLVLLIVCVSFTVEKDLFMETVEGISCETQQAQIKTQEWKFVCGSALSSFSASPPSNSHSALCSLKYVSSDLPFLALIHFISSSGAELT